MTMVRPKGKAQKIAKKVMKGKTGKTVSPDTIEKKPLSGPYLQH